MKLWKEGPWIVIYIFFSVFKLTWLTVWLAESLTKLEEITPGCLNTLVHCCRTLWRLVPGWHREVQRESQRHHFSPWLSIAGGCRVQITMLDLQAFISQKTSHCGATLRRDLVRKPRRSTAGWGQWEILLFCNECCSDSPVCVHKVLEFFPPTKLHVGPKSLDSFPSKTRIQGLKTFFPSENFAVMPTTRFTAQFQPQVKSMHSCRALLPLPSIRDLWCSRNLHPAASGGGSTDWYWIVQTVSSRLALGSWQLPLTQSLLCASLEL